MGPSDYVDGLQLILQPGPLIAIAIGAFVGLLFGVIPGLSGATALAIALSLVLFMDPMTAIALMIAVYAANTWGGSVTAILLNIPGTGGSTATAVDGYPLTKSGRAGEAIAAGRSAAFVGGLFGATVLLFFAPVVARWATRFGIAEFLALAIFGVTVVAAVSEKSLLKGLTSGWIGFLVATIGQDPTVGYARFTFGRIELLGGLHLIWVIVGMFAISQALQLASGRDSYVRYEGKVKVPWAGAWPVLWKNRGLVATTSSIGTFIGMIPGAGATIAAWLGYNQAKRMSKTPERFGSGAIEGVIGPEAANDAVDGGSLIPTMTLAIPGSGSAAIILGGLVLAGMRPGPRLFRDQAPEAVAVMLAFVLANLAMFVVAVVSMRWMIRVLSIEPKVWPPAIMVLGVFGAFVIEQRIFGSYVAIVVGIAAYLLVARGFPLPPALLGFILAPILERNFIRLETASRGDPLGYMLGKPVAMAILLLAVAAMVMDVRQRVFKKGKSQAQAST